MTVIKFAGPDPSSVDRELPDITTPDVGDVLRPDPTPILETAQLLAELVAIRDRAR